MENQPSKKRIMINKTSSHKMKLDFNGKADGAEASAEQAPSEQTMKKLPDKANNTSFVEPTNTEDDN